MSILCAEEAFTPRWTKCPISPKRVTSPMDEEYAQDPDCDHYGVECEGDCPCWCVDCEDPEVSDSSDETSKGYREWISGTSHP